jgi:mannitol/fructose-specific phosphotransferase system IIA component (Ntr-type)
LLLTDLLSIDRIRIPLQATTKDDLLRELVALVTADSSPAEREDVLRAVRERESVLSTGIGYGVAIPHGKSSAVRELAMAAGRAGGPKELDALHGQPARLFLLLVGPETAAGPHIKALRRDDVRARLIAAGDEQAFLRALEEAEA